MSNTRKRFDDEAYLRSCTATVIGVNADGIELDQTVCYARSGGQAGDTAAMTLSDGRAVDVVDTIYADERRRILHVPRAESPMPRVGELITVTINWERRYKLMRLHTCLHLLGSLIPAPVTSCGISPDSARIDFDLPESTLVKAELTERVNALIKANTEVRITPIAPTDFARQPELVRTIGATPPTRASIIRIVDISGVDRQPCGGTHVANTQEIGEVIVTKIEKKSRTNRRIVVTFA